MTLRLTDPLEILIQNGIPLKFNNAGNDEFGSIYRDDDYLYIDSGTGGELLLQVAGASKAYFGSSSNYMYQHTYMRSGQQLLFNNSGNTESGNIYRDDDYLYVDSGTGGQMRIQIAGASVLGLSGSIIESYAQDWRIRDAGTLRFYNSTDAEYGEIYRDDNNLYVNSGTGGNLVLQNAGVSTFNIFSGFTSHPAGAIARFYNAGNDEFGSIYRNDDTLIIDSGTGGNLGLYVAGTLIEQCTAGGVVIRDGLVVQFNNSGNTESGDISRDDNYLYVKGGTGGGLQLESLGELNLQAEGDIQLNPVNGDPIEMLAHIIVPIDTSVTANPPTKAQLDLIFGTPAAVGAGFRALMDNNGAGTNFYEVASDGTNWWIFTGTKAV